MRYIFGLLIGIGLIVLTFILIFRIFGGDDKQAPQAINLTSYANTSTVVRLTVDGPIVANQRHEQLRITVGRDEVLFERFQGYQNDLAASRNYPNNSDAYNSFLHALNNLGFTQGNADAPKDERGFCPNGRRYVYEAIGDGKSNFRWWNTNCGNDEGSFLGKGNDIRRLFISQVPDYRSLVRGTGLD